MIVIASNGHFWKNRIFHMNFNFSFALQVYYDLTVLSCANWVVLGSIHSLPRKAFKGKSGLSAFSFSLRSPSLGNFLRPSKGSCGYFLQLNTMSL